MRYRVSLAFLLGASLAMAATAQTKISGQLQCGKPDEVHTVDVGDRKGHSMAISKTPCTWLKAMDIGGSPTKAGVSVATADRNAAKSWELGFHTGTTADGDMFFVRFQDIADLKDGKPVKISGTWNFTGGTGKHKNLKGKGKFAGGTPDADGNITFDIEGEYTQ